MVHVSVGIVIQSSAKMVSLPRFVFVQAGLGFSSSCPDDEGVEGEGGWGVWESVGRLFSPRSYLVLLQAVQCFGGEMSLKRQGVKVRAKMVSTQTSWSSFSLPTSDANGCLQKLAFYSETAERRQLKMRLSCLLNWKENKAF